MVTLDLPQLQRVGSLTVEGVDSLQIVALPA